MPRLPVFRIVCLSLVLSCGAWGQEVLEGIAAVVNKDIVTFSQVRELTSGKEKQARDTWKSADLLEKIKDIRAAAVNELIEQTLILQEFSARGYSIPEKAINEQIDTIIHEEFHGDRAAFLAHLAGQGYTPDSFRRLQRDHLIVQLMRNEASKGAPAEAKEQREKDWLQELRKKAYLKVP